MLLKLMFAVSAYTAYSKTLMKGCAESLEILDLSNRAHLFPFSMPVYPVLQSTPSYCICPVNACSD